MIRSRQRADLTDIVVAVGVGFVGLLAARNTLFFTIIAPPIILRALARSPADAPQRMIPAAARLHAVMVWPLLAVMAVAGVAEISTELRPSSMATVWARTLPVGAVDYLERTHPPGPMFNTWAWGGYLLWRMPDTKVYMDGRTELYGDGFVLKYLAMVDGAGDWQGAFRQQGIRLVVIDTDAGLAKLLRQSPEWTQGYRDQVAAVFVRR